MNSETPLWVHIQKLVHGGQGLGELPDGRKVFVWNALPGETLRIRLIRQKRSFAEAIAEEVSEPSPDRVLPREANFLATSPWQMMSFTAENRHKKLITDEIFKRAKVRVPEFSLTATGQSYGYRNKIEYGFWGDDSGLHLATYRRGSHGKDIVNGSALSMPGMDAAANDVCTVLGRHGVRAGDLKTIIVRSSQNGAIAASLFVKPERFPKLMLPQNLQGLRIYHSNPKSPASVSTKLLQQLGDCTLRDTLLGKEFVYNVDSFFQINLSAYEQALSGIKAQLSTAELVDMYAGVGSIGLSVASEAVDLIEVDPATADMARRNTTASELKARVIETSSEEALEYITTERPISLDPPRAGLHDKVVTRILEAKPPRISYLSCNPITQARDLTRLQDAYIVDFFEAFNFFPRTPHIETLAILQRRA